MGTENQGAENPAVKKIDEFIASFKGKEHFHTDEINDAKILKLWANGDKPDYFISK